jgi:hypothetical protein
MREGEVMADLTRDEAKALYGEMTNTDLQAELGERNLPKTGVKDELVARLLDADFPPPADDPDAGDPPAEDGELCRACWPDGWPTSDTNNASCEHGVWDR